MTKLEASFARMDLSEPDVFVTKRGKVQEKFFPSLEEVYQQ
jgi:hypothetical protein